MQNVSFDDVTRLTVPAPDERVDWGAEALQFGEMWVPRAGTRRAIIVLLHGGCWQNAYGVDHVRPAAHALREAGFAVWAPEYRRLGDEGSGWPGTFEDVAAACDFVGRYRRGEERVIYMGHSAGGHLALWSSARSTFAPEALCASSDALRPDAVVSLAGIFDLAGYASGSSPCERSAADLIGGAPPAWPERYAQASPARLRLPERTRFLQGADDPIVPVSQVDRAGSHVTIIPDCGHFDLIHPQTPAFRRLLTTLEDLL